MITMLSNSQAAGIKKILIIQHKPFGDVLLNTGYLPELRRRFPEAQIDYLIQRPFMTILENNPYIDNLVIMEKEKGVKFYLAALKTALQVRKNKYDLIIDQLRGTSSARIVLFSGAEFKLGFKLKPKKILGIKFNRWNSIYNIHSVKGDLRYYSRLKFDLLMPLGIRETDHNTQYYINNSSLEYIKYRLQETGLVREQLIVFSAGTPVKKKQWSLDCYAQLGDMIQHKLKYKVVLLWGPGEKKDAEYIQNKMLSEAVIAPPTDFNQAGALLHFARVLITNDGGINHLAVSQNVPSIAVFGAKSNPVKWCAWHKPIHTYLRDWNHKDLNENSFNITPRQVFDKLQEMLEIIESNARQDLISSFNKLGNTSPKFLQDQPLNYGRLN